MKLFIYIIYINYITRHNFSPTRSVINYITRQNLINYITQHNFFPTRSVTSGNRTPGSRFYSDLLDTLADSVCVHQLVLKRRSKSQAARIIAWLVPINAHHVMFNWSSHGGQNENRTLLQRSQRCRKGEFRHVSISTQQRLLRRGQNLRVPFLRATPPMTVGSCARAMADNGGAKGLITPPCMSFCTIIIR